MKTMIYKTVGGFTQFWYVGNIKYYNNGWQIYPIRQYNASNNNWYTINLSPSLFSNLSSIVPSFGNSIIYYKYNSHFNSYNAFIYYNYTKYNPSQIFKNTSNNELLFVFNLSGVKPSYLSQSVSDSNSSYDYIFSSYSIPSDITISKNGGEYIQTVVNLSHYYKYFFQNQNNGELQTSDYILPTSTTISYSWYNGYWIYDSINQYVQEYVKFTQDDGDHYIMINRSNTINFTL